MKRRERIHFGAWLTLAILLGACSGDSNSLFNGSAYSLNTSNYLYVVSGACYGGGVALATGPSNMVTRWDLNSGQMMNVVVDYNALAPGDSPVGIFEYDSQRILVLIENALGRRIDLVNKDGSGVASYLVNATALNAVLRAITLLPDFSVLVVKNTAIERFNAAKSRVTQGANPYVNSPTGACATSNTLMSSVITSPTGKIIYTHAGGTPNNKVGVIAATGFAAGADCLAAQTGPTTTALPTRAILHSSGKLLVAYGSLTAASNFIYSYDYNDSTGAISNAAVAYNDNSVVNGPSSLAEDPATGDVYVANVTSTFNTIEKFSYSAGVLTRAAGEPFVPYNAFTRCVADLKVID